MFAAIPAFLAGTATAAPVTWLAQVPGREGKGPPIDDRLSGPALRASDAGADQ